MDFGFYIDSKGRTVTECQCGSFVVFVPESEAISRLCFRCGKTVERPLIERLKEPKMDIDSERDDEPDDFEELNDNEAVDYSPDSTDNIDDVDNEDSEVEQEKIVEDD